MAMKLLEDGALHEFIHDSFKALVLNPRFACVAAKSAVRNGNYRMGYYADLDERSVVELAQGLKSFIAEQDSMEGFSTFVATFSAPFLGGEAEFEARLWRVLQALHEIDDKPWDAAVSSDPESPEFSFSFGGRSFFIVGLHPTSSRFTRRFAFPTLVFNAHEQFEALRREGKFSRMQDIIRKRDLLLQGTPNATLAAYGDSSEARQYAGRAVNDSWKCPFHRKP